MNKRHSQSKQKARAELSARYLAALRRHLDDERADNGDRAQGLGRAVLEAGLAPLDLAIMHEKAVVTLTASRDLTTLRSSWFIRKGFFFTQALIPIEAALRATEATVSQLHHRNETLRLHTAALTRGNLRLQREVLRRQSGETAIMKGQAKYRVLFLESQVMQKKLRQLARQILSAQEEERKKISRELHDEVVQTLVGINVELAALGRGATIGVHTLKSKIAHTQRLVEHSVNSVHRFARELRPAVLDDLGLIPALHAYSKSLAARKKIKIRLTAFSGVEALADAKRTVLFA